MTNTMSEKDDITILGGKSETTEKDWNDFWAAGESDGDWITDYVGAAQAVPFTLFDGAPGQDTITFDLNMDNELPKSVIRESNNGFWKYEEDLTLKEVQDYLSGTYKAHYTSQESKTQTLDLIESIGDAEAFCRSNAIKYLSRFGKKNGKSKLDILKAIHYCVLLYHFSGLHTNNTNGYETF